MQKIYIFVKDIIRISGSNLFKLFSGILVGLLLPKIIGVTDYGYYKTYSLYIHYVGLLHFGILDGIYLKYGGVKFCEIDKASFRSYIRFLMILELIFSIIFIIIANLFTSGEYRFIFIYIAIYLFFGNISSYFQMISQITSRFKELSRRTTIQSTIISAAVLALYYLNRRFSFNFTYHIYTLFYTLTIVILSLWYVYTYRSIIFGESIKLNKSLADITSFAKIGFPLTVSNICSTLILSIDRQFVNILFSTQTYAIYAFAYNILALITASISSISTVLYPNLRRESQNYIWRNYSILTGIILAIVFAALTMYFPIDIFINWFLPKYAKSIPIFRIIFPGLAVSSAITIVTHNCYKIAGINHIFFTKSIITIAISLISNYVVYFIFKSPYSISAASIFVMLFWHFYLELYLAIQYKINRKRNFIYIFAMTTAFYILTLLKNDYLACLLYSCTYIMITYLCFKTDINILKRKLAG